ncbi:MAG: alpha/beta fold hydrolase [Candidatus Micrarchaeota archaeon]
MKKEKIIFENSKGQKLAGVMVTPEKPKATVVFAHGLDGSRAGFEDFYDLVDAGYRIFAFDFVGRGESEGTTEDITLENDVDSLNSAVKLMKGPVAVVGFSFGGSAALMAAIENPQVKCLITWSTGYDFSFVDYKQVKKDGFFILSRPDHRYTFELIDGLRKANLPEKAKEVKVPWLDLHGDADETIEVEQALKLHKNGNKPKKQVIIKGAAHNFMRPSDIETATKEIIEWLDKWMAKL